MEKKRSVGIMICGVIMLFYSLYLLRNSTMAFFNFKNLPLFYRVRMVMRPVCLITLLPGLIYLIASVGILRMKNWSRLLIIYFSILLLLLIFYVAISIIPGIIRRDFEGPAAIGLLPLVLIIPLLPSLLFLIFFTRPKVKEQFK